MLAAKIYDGDLCNRAPYIYCIFSKQLGCAYIGQTFSYLGALGRLAQHLSESSSNTFRQRVCSVYRFDDVNLKEIEFFACRLPDRKSFKSKGADYREAVEYLTNYGVIGALKDRSVGVSIISRTSSNAYTRLGYVQDSANKIVNHIVDCICKTIED